MNRTLVAISYATLLFADVAHGQEVADEETGAEAHAAEDNVEVLLHAGEVRYGFLAQIVEEPQRADQRQHIAHGGVAREFPRGFREPPGLEHAVGIQQGHEKPENDRQRGQFQIRHSDDLAGSVPELQLSFKGGVAGARSAA